VPLGFGALLGLVVLAVEVVDVHGAILPGEVSRRSTTRPATP